MKAAGILSCVLLSAVAQSAVESGPPLAGALIVKGAWSSSSDSVTPLPEGGGLTDGTYNNEYFGLTYTLSRGWTERFSGPPPSDSGYYVLAQIEPKDLATTANSGHVLIAAQDMFFARSPAANTAELVGYTQSHLDSDYRVERAPTLVRIGQTSFLRFDYTSSASKLHWHVFATQIRCHVVQFVYTGRDASSLERLIDHLGTLKLPNAAGVTAGTGGDGNPVCIKDFASADNVVSREDPVFTEPRFNPVPVRIVIDIEGRVKHIHFLSAYPEQAKSIADALSQWRFKPYAPNGRAVEVETGLVFGHAAAPLTSTLH
jgi:hypothetical protein